MKDVEGDFGLSGVKRARCRGKERCCLKMSNSKPIDGDYILKWYTMSS